MISSFTSTIELVFLTAETQRAQRSEEPEIFTVDRNELKVAIIDAKG
jgi:hypothetical protein